MSTDLASKIHAVLNNDPGPTVSGHQLATQFDCTIHEAFDAVSLLENQTESGPRRVVVFARRDHMNNLQDFEVSVSDDSTP